MKGYLIDTNVIAKIAPHKIHDKERVEWFEENTQKLYISSITIAEIEAGIAKLFREGAVRKAESLKQWLETIIHLYSSRILPLDLKAAREAGRLIDMSRSLGHNIGFADCAIAAIAKTNDLKLYTHNIKDFEFFDIELHRV